MNDVASRSARVLVTGSSGQLGREVCAQLRAAGFEPFGVDVVPGPATDATVDVRDAGALRAAARGAAAVVHAASLHAPHVGARPRRDFVDVNVAGTLHALEAALAAGARRFVYTSTTSVYGEALVPVDRAVWVTEALPPRPRDVYDVTKLAAEGLCQDAARVEGLGAFVLRVCRFFPEPGPRRAAHRLYRGADVRDVAAAHVLALRAPAPPAGRAELVNVAGAYRFEPGDAVELWRAAPSVIARRYPEAPALFARRGWPLPERIDRVYVSERAAAVLGYAPRYGLGALEGDELRTGPRPRRPSVTRRGGARRGEPALRFSSFAVARAARGAGPAAHRFSPPRTCGRRSTR
jgi:nucleoside-diphosphate-sugar epimerase